ncbi:MAG: hypothetical protein U1D69_00550 [Polynucleobacter sp.]|uniref:hypothetical protein n=1 Tax=Limnobacter sp. TaxID=2003368 RepID=UPI0027375E52|nr:hypothetical protein [Limnobacter sp.]MDP3270608.1 hypothetical protein [Limnobacter sp.]MDZ4055453.1 hypothetical protein [Polynucleobacter sp.]
MKANSKAAEFEAEALGRLARIRSGGETLKLDAVKKLVCEKAGYKRAANTK